MIFKGIIKNISEVKTGKTKNGEDYAVRNFLIEEQKDQYPESIYGQVFKKGEYAKYLTDNFSLKVGDIVEVEYNLKAEEYNGKYYQKIGIWKITKDDVQQTVNQDDDSQDLPF